jgi:ATP-dependent protease ClpP protease subunit
MRRINIIGSIDDDTFRKFCEDLAELESKGASPITVDMTSEGGYTFSALAFVGRMRDSKCDIHIRAYGYVASAAVLILAAADKSSLSRESWVMTHEDSGKVKGTTTTMRAELAQYKRQERQWNTLMAYYCGCSVSFWADFHTCKDEYLTADQCLEYGIVDEVF